MRNSSFLAALLVAAVHSSPVSVHASTDSTATDTITFDGQAFLDSLRDSYIDSVASSYSFRHGTVALDNGVATLEVPAGFKFLDKDQSRSVLVDLWGNPSAEGVLGMVFPEGDDVFADSSYAFVVQYDEIGYVKDDDADDIDYDDLLKQLQEEEVEENKQRASMGYEPVYTVGWAAQPFYDKERKILHWAKELQFGDSAAGNTLNYNVRVLGRKGVLILNAVSSMGQLGMVQQHVPEVLGIVQFNDGYKYEQFDSNVDEVAAWTIGGLVAGKVLAKAGLFAIIAKFGKVIVLGLLAAGGAIWRFFGGKERKKKDQPPTTLPPAA